MIPEFPDLKIGQFFLKRGRGDKVSELSNSLNFQFFRKISESQYSCITVILQEYEGDFTGYEDTAVKPLTAEEVLEMLSLSAPVFGGQV